jgi:hypothetical protein
MRRTRGFFNGWVFTLLLTATLGYFAVRHWPAPRSTTKSDINFDTPATTAPDDHADAGDKAAKTAKGPRRDTASAHESGSDDSKLESEHDLRSEASKIVAEGPSKEKPHLSEADHAPAKLMKVAKSMTHGFCESVEYRGNGHDGTPSGVPVGPWGVITNDQWDKVLTQFHGAKKDLLAWLSEHRYQFTKEVADHMEDDVRDLRLQRPPAPDFPDLSFRGIGLWSRPQGERPIIKLGTGFAKLAEHNPARARFELSRLIAQSWGPCELRKSPISAHLPKEGPWNDLLSCLGVHDENACAPGSLSESGWAVSTALAAVASPPGCTVPAFATGVGEGCLKDIRSKGSRLPASRTASSKPVHHRGVE